MAGVRFGASRHGRSAASVALTLLVALVVGGLVAIGAPAPRASATGNVTPTVVAVVEPNGFNPYHFDFLGSQHPWNKDANPANDIDFTADPATYITGYPGATPLTLSLPTAGTDDASSLRAAADSAAWNSFASSAGAPSVSMYRFPGTKVVGAVRFGSPFWASNDAHGTRSAASAVGNIHGTCPECLVVLVAGTTGLQWALKQSWIDVVTNSYKYHYVQADEIRDGLDPGPVQDTLDAVTAGQSVVWSAGNGIVNSLLDVPEFTYTSRRTGPDWVVTVGATDHGEGMPSSGKPADISADGVAYPSTGGSTANGTGQHSGTSNAAPVVAGTIAKVIQLARTALGSTSGGHSGGVVATGTAVACGAGNPSCVLGDGKLTRREAEQLVFDNVSPDGGALPPVTEESTATMAELAAASVPYPALPTTPVAYFYLGHGVVHGRDDVTKMAAQQARFGAALIGTVAPLPRPVGERSWMIADSMCRQRVWGSWSGGYYDDPTGADPAVDPLSPLAAAWVAWCTPANAAAFRQALNEF